MLSPRGKRGNPSMCVLRETGEKGDRRHSPWFLSWRSTFPPMKFPGKGQSSPVYGANLLTRVPLTCHLLGMSVSHIHVKTMVRREDNHWESSLTTTHIQTSW